MAQKDIQPPNEKNDKSFTEEVIEQLSKKENIDKITSALKYTFDAENSPLDKLMG